ncbi:hypothetical protein BGZ65_001139, partial [Modicella reniformis]
TDVGIVQGASIGDLKITLTDTGFSFSSSKFTAKLKSVPGINWPLTESVQHVTVVDNDYDIITFDTPSSPTTVSNGVVSSVLQTSS